MKVNWKTIHLIILSVTCHSIRNFSLLIHIPSYPFMYIWNPMSYYFWVWVICKRFNMNWQKIHSITLSVTCHSIRNFSPLIHNPSYPFMNFWNSTIDYFLSLSHSWKIESELENNSLNNFICHLSFHKKLFPTHTQPLISICEFLKLYNWLFLEFESFMKDWM